MSFARQVSQTLDAEHRANIGLLDRLDRAFGGGLAEADWPPLANALVRQLEHEVVRHFGFEEDELFPRLADAGDGGIAALLTEEHTSIRAVADELLPLARAMGQAALPAADRAAFKRLTLELIERMVSHIQKETMALLPMLDDLLDDDTDRELAFTYAAE
jgi:hemerythrin-like domain-containing protein